MKHYFHKEIFESVFNKKTTTINILAKDYLP